MFILPLGLLCLVFGAWLLADGGGGITLGVAMKSLPVGVAYAVWVAIGAVGTALSGMLLFDEPASAARVLSLLLIGLGVVGLKLSTPWASASLKCLGQVLDQILHRRVRAQHVALDLAARRLRQRADEMDLPRVGVRRVARLDQGLQLGDERR